MRRTCLTQSTWKVAGWCHKLWQSVMQTTVSCYSSLIPFTPDQQAKWVPFVLAHKSSHFTFVLPSFIPLLSTQPSSVSLHSFSGLLSLSIIRRVFHHERKRKKKGDTCCRIHKLSVNLYMGHSMSNQHKKIPDLSDLDETWCLHSACWDIHP